MRSAQGLLSRAVHVASAIALVLAVLLSPIRPAPGHGSCHVRNCLRRNFALRPVRLAVTPPAMRASQVKAISSEGKEEWTGASGRGPYFRGFLSPTTHVPPTSRSVVGVASPALRPLRC